MKIYPLNNLKSIFYINNANKNKENNNKSDLPQVDKLPDTYRMITFGGDDISGFKSRMLSLDDIHCPACGQKMLSKEKARKIVNEAVYVRSISEYAKLLEKNKDYLHPEYRPFVMYVNKFAQTRPDMSFNELFKIINSGAISIIKNKLNDNSKYLMDFANNGNLSEIDRVKILDLAHYFEVDRQVPKYSELKQNLSKTLSSMDSEKKWEVYEKIKNELHDVYCYNYALRCRDNKSIGMPIQAIVLQNMLNGSVSNLVDIYPNSKPEKRYSKFLLCGSCTLGYKPSMVINSSQKAEKNLKGYIEDISNAIVDGKIDKDNLYLYEFIGTARAYTKGNLNIQRCKVNSIAKSRIFTENKSEYMFSNYEDIPCACCGTVTLTHEQKQKLYKQIDESSNLNELLNIARVNSEHINPKYENIISRFSNIINMNPGIDEDDVMDLMAKLSISDLRHQILRNKRMVLSYVLNKKLNPVDKAFVKDYFWEIEHKYKDMDDKSNFRYDEYQSMIERTLGKLGPIHRNELIKLANEKIKILYVKDLVVNPLPELVEKTGSRAKVMFQNIFRASVITVDHTQSKDSGGEDKYYNKVGYCRDCNREKSNMKFSDWYKIHPEISENLPKHLKKVSEIIKKEKIKKMYDYPEKAAKLAMKLTKDKLVIPNKYDTKG